MKYYAIINTNTNRISSWCGIVDGVGINTKENEVVRQITQEQADVLGSKEAEFIIEDGNLIIGQLFDKTPLPPEPPTETELLGQQLVEKELQILELQQENQALGQQLVDIDLRLLQGGL